MKKTPRCWNIFKLNSKNGRNKSKIGILNIIQINSFRALIVYHDLQTPETSPQQHKIIFVSFKQLHMTHSGC